MNVDRPYGLLLRRFRQRRAPKLVSKSGRNRTRFLGHLFKHTQIVMTFITKVRWKKITIGKAFQLNILCEKRVLFVFKIWKKNVATRL